MTMKDAAKETGIPKTTLKRLCEEGMLHGMKISGQWFVSEGAISEFFKNNKGEVKLPKAKKSKRPQPAHLAAYQEKLREQGKLKHKA